jgi:hypothetical protein
MGYRVGEHVDGWPPPPCAYCGVDGTDEKPLNLTGDWRFACDECVEKYDVVVVERRDPKAA